MAHDNVLYLRNDNIVELDRLRRRTDGAYINAGSVQLTQALDEDGNAVSGITVPMSFAYVSASDGRYRATLPYTAGFAHGEYYKLTIVADGGSGERGEWEHTYLCKRRTGA